jgi:hypothetical protein
MSAESDRVLAQIDALFSSCAVAPEHLPEAKYYVDRFSTPEIAARTTRAQALIDRCTLPGSPYREASRDTRGAEQVSSGFRSGSILSHVMGVLAALRADVEAGYLLTLEELVHADLFADFLEMAAELLEKQYKDPAAVLAGSVLEEHLRKLAQRNGVDIEKHDGSPVRADALNAELAKVPAYNKLVQKSVTAWLDLRNKAAHGQHTQYDDAQVAALIRDVRDFMTRHPA